MQSKYGILQEKEQASEQVAQQITVLLEMFLAPLLEKLDLLLDKRLLRTLVQSISAIIRFRNPKQGLLLSELGSYLDGYPGLSTTAPAGTKRLGNLIRSLKWQTRHIDQYLLKEADAHVKKIHGQGKKLLCILDGSVLEKAESEKLEGTAPVLSSKAKRLMRSKRGLVYNKPPEKPIQVMGMEWTAALITGMDGLVRVAVMSWWTRKGAYGITQQEKEEEVLRICIRQWGALPTYALDRGYAAARWIVFFMQMRVRWVIRWKKGHVFVDVEGREKKLWQIGFGKKYRTQKLLRKSGTGMKIPVALWWSPIRHEATAEQLYLLRARVKNKVWYLVTNERIRTEEDAWEIFFCYKRRWQIELSFRYGKCELAMESPRVWSMENRLKFLSLVVLTYAFLLFLLEDLYAEIREAVLRLECHRTGKRCQEAQAPLYRLRWAISRLWERHRPIFGSLFPPGHEVFRVLPHSSG